MMTVSLRFAWLDGRTSSHQRSYQSFFFDLPDLGSTGAWVGSGDGADDTLGA